MPHEQTAFNGPKYAALGEAIIGQLGALRHPVWCYFEAIPGRFDIAVFVDHGATLEWVYPDQAVIQALMAAWEAEPEVQRWAGMEYIIGGGRFTTRFTYADEFNPDDYPSDRRAALIAQHFGNKEVRYPAW